MSSTNKPYGKLNIIIATNDTIIQFATLKCIIKKSVRDKFNILSAHRNLSLFILKCNFIAISRTNGDACTTIYILLVTCCGNKSILWERTTNKE